MAPGRRHYQRLSRRPTLHGTSGPQGLTASRPSTAAATSRRRWSDRRPTRTVAGRRGAGRRSRAAAGAAGPVTAVARQQRRGGRVKARAACRACGLSGGDELLQRRLPGPWSRSSPPVRVLGRTGQHPLGERWESAASTGARRYCTPSAESARPVASAGSGRAPIGFAAPCGHCVDGFLSPADDVVRHRRPDRAHRPARPRCPGLHAAGEQRRRPRVMRRQPRRRPTR